MNPLVALGILIFFVITVFKAPRKLNTLAYILVGTLLIATCVSLIAYTVFTLIPGHANIPAATGDVAGITLDIALLALTIKRFRKDKRERALANSKNTVVRF